MFVLATSNLLVPQHALQSLLQVWTEFLNFTSLGMLLLSSTAQSWSYSDLSTGVSSGHRMDGVLVLWPTQAVYEAVQLLLGAPLLALDNATQLDALRKKLRGRWGPGQMYCATSWLQLYSYPAGLPAYTIWTSGHYAQLMDNEAYKHA
jgi:hypothetical protein